MAVKMLPEMAAELRERYDGVRPAYHMNKRHWSDLYLNLLDEDFVRQCIRESFWLVASKLPKGVRERLAGSEK